MAYIDRDDFFGSFPELDIEPYKSFPTAEVVEKERYDRLLENATIISDALNKYQTADEVKVVRCKDCVHWGSTISQADREQCASEGVDLVCAYWESDGLYADDFCSYGERKETEDVEKAD